MAEDFTVRELQLSVVWYVSVCLIDHILLCLQSRQFPDANLPGVPPDQTKAIFEAAIRTLVQLQSVDTDKLDLDGIGDKENFFHQRVSTQNTTKSYNM